MVLAKVKLKISLNQLTCENQLSNLWKPNKDSRKTKILGMVSRNRQTINSIKDSENTRNLMEKQCDKMIDNLKH